MSRIAPAFLAVFPRLPLPWRWRYAMQWRAHYWWLRLTNTEVSETAVLAEVKALHDKLMGG